jgi:hypothetical protein
LVKKLTRSQILQAIEKYIDELETGMMVKVV